MKKLKTNEELQIEINQLKSKISDLERSKLQSRNCTPVRNDEGKLDNIMLVSSEITTPKQAEEALQKSESIIQNRLKAVTEPSGNIDTLELADIIDVEILKSIMDDFYQLTGMLAAVLDLNGNVLVAVGWNDICTKFHRCNPDTLKNCIESDTVLTQGVPAGTCKAYQCKNNMWDIVTPLIVGGRHVGNIFMGQYFLEGNLPDVELFRKQAVKYGFDEEEYLAALDRVPIFSQKNVDRGMQFYSKLAGIISTLSYSTIQQSKLLAERKKTEDDLRLSEAKFRSYVEQASEGIYLLQFKEPISVDMPVEEQIKYIYDGYIIEANDSQAKMYGFDKANELNGMTLAELHGGTDDPVNLEFFKSWIEANYRITDAESKEVDKGGNELWFTNNVIGHVEDGYLIHIWGTQINTTEKKQAEENTKKNQAILQQAEKISNQGAWEWDIVQDKWSFSENWLNIHGCQLSGINRAELMTIAYPEDAPRIEKAFQDALKGDAPYDLEHRIIRQNDGKERYVRAAGDFIYDNSGKQVKMYGVTQDITDKKQAEDRIRAAEENLKNTFDLSPSIIAKANMNEGRFIQVNKAITKILGYSIDEFTSRPYMEFVHPDDRQSTIDIATEQLKGNDVTFFENRYLCKDGSYKWMAWHGTKPDDDGVVTTIGSDINERKHAELKLNQSTKLLEASQSIAKLGGWELDIATNNLFWTAETYRIHETSPEEFDPTVDAAVGYFLPESRRIISNALEAAIKDGEGYDLELETLTTKGRRIDVRTTCEVIRLDGKPTKLTGIFQDITEQKQAEEKMRTVKEKLKNTFDISPSIICKADLGTGYFIEANQAVTRILGYSVEEFTSKPLIEFIHQDDRQRTIDEISEQLDGKETTFFENRYLCKNGSYKWMAWHSTKADKHGIVTAIASDISERRIIEQEIIETKQFYENIIEGVQDGIWVTDKNDVIFYANSAMEKIAGVPREQIQGNNVLKDFPEDVTGEFNKFYKQAKKEKKPLWYVVKVTTAANKIVWENGWLIPQYQNKAFNGIICTVRDISKRKQAEGSVRKLSTAVQQSPSTIVIADTEGKVEYVNPKFTELTGYSSSEVIGKDSNILKSGEQDAEFYKEMWKVLESKEVWRGQFHNRKKNGKLFWESASISAILNESGDVINYIKVGEDITLQKNTETELKIALEKALESDRLKSAFLANMSHEIRTPMNGIRGFINLLNEPNLSQSEINTYSDIINKSSDRLLNTINDIIDLSRIEAGEVLISNTTISIQSVMNEIYNFHSSEAELKGLSLSLEPSICPEQTNIITDGDKLHGILTNLVKNAIKYTEKGSITLGYSLKNKCIDFFVEDTGVGIPKDREQAIFNRFEQADFGNRRAYDGSGLGLAISKAYAEMLGGKIWVKSELGKGSVFYFSLPYKGETIKVNSAKNEILPTPELCPIKSLKILIVEDDEVSKELITITVKKFGKEIISARTGTEAVSACLNNPNIDLVLMDIQMPEMDGYKATREIRKFNKDLIIVAQTAYALNGDKQKALDAGCNDYISKPINEKLLWEIIDKHIGK